MTTAIPSDDDRCANVPSVPEELLIEIGPHYKTVWETVTIGPRDFHFLTIEDPETLLDEKTLAQTHGELEIQPYWAQAWDAAYALAEYLFEIPELPTLNVMEIGCGLGITGAVAASIGAKVTMGDYATPALPFARVNSYPWQQTVDVQQINWRTDQLDQKFDLIIGADVLYDRDEIPFLDQFCRRHLNNDGAFLHADPHRAMTVEYINSLTELGWSARQSTFNSKTVSKRIRLVEFRV